MKRRFVKFAQHMAASVFIGISVYGAIMYYGGEIQNKIPATQSILLGLGAVVCLVVVVVLGGIDDRMAAMDDINGDTSA